MTTITFTNQFLVDLGLGMVNLNTDSIKALLMKSTFVFSASLRSFKKNIITNTGAVSLSFADSGNSITRNDAGSFITDGFVTGAVISTDAELNPGPFTIASVHGSGLILYLQGSGVVDEGPVTKTVTCNEELANGSGYSADTKVLENQAFSWSDTVAKLIADNILWTATGGDIGPAVGLILYDDTASDDVIIAYVLFTDPGTAGEGYEFLISNVTLTIAKA